MNLDELLRSAAYDVAGQAPDTDLPPALIHTRARQIRRRRRIGATAGVVAAAVLTSIGLSILVDTDTAIEPVQPAPRTPTSSASGDAVVSVPEITDDDLRDYEVLATETNTDGETELEFDVAVRDRYTFEWSHFCVGDPDTWYVIIVGTGGASGSGYCQPSAAESFPTIPTSISPFGHSGNAAETLHVRMFVTGPIPQKHLDCFDRESPADCQDITPALEPLASTDVTFGISVYEYWAPSVAEVADQQVAALARADGVDHVLSQVVEPLPGRPDLSLTLPDSGRDRLVAVVDTVTDELIECDRSAANVKEHEACTPVLELRIAGRTVLLERGEFGDVPMLGGSHGFFRVPPGRARTVEVRVASGDPANVDYSLLVFEEAR